MWVAGLSVVCALVGVVSNAGAGLTPGGPPGNGIEGVVVSDSCHGAGRPDGAGCRSHPIRAEVRVLRRRDHSEVTRFHSRKRDGRFKVALKPGRYILDPLEHGFDLYKGVIHVRVREHTWLRVEIHYRDGGA
jgi:hypothetical protein